MANFTKVTLRVVESYNCAMQTDVLDSDLLVTIGDLLSAPDLAIEAALLPEGAAAVPVSWVHATEQIDPRPHLRQYELVCTLGSSLVESREARRFVEAVTNAGASAIALGLGEVHLEPPRALIEACAGSNIPLLLVPHGVPFLAVNDALLKKRTERESEVRRQETALLSQLFSLARAGASEKDLIDLASTSLSREIVVGAPASGRMTIGTNAPAESATNAGGKVPSAEFLEQLGSLVEFSRRETDRAHNEKLQQVGQLIDLIEKGLAHPAAAAPDFDALSLDTANLRVSRWPRGSESSIAKMWPNALIGVTARDTIVISGDEPVDSISSMGLVCGYSSLVSLTTLRRGLTESRSAFKLARSKGGVAGPTEIVSVDALLEQVPFEQLSTFIEQLLAPIEVADDSGRGGLLETLRTYLHLNQNIMATGDALGVHVNTVRNRLERIRALTGRDPQRLLESVDLYIAIWAAEHKAKIGHRLIRPLT